MAEDDTPGQVIKVERDGEIASVILNRPERLNALHRPMWEGLLGAFRALSADPTLRCVILRGVDGRAFSPGADIAEFATERASPAQAEAYGTFMEEVFTAIATCLHPTIARIEGACCGAGLVLALMCDLRICGEGSRFGIPINRLGLAFAYPELQALVGVVGCAAALEMLLEGRIFGAAEAREKGLVNRVVPDGAVAEEVAATARRIADGAPLAARWHKKFVRRLADPRPLTAEELSEPYQSFGTRDYHAGFRAFLAKQKPVFEGR